MSKKSYLLIMLTALIKTYTVFGKEYSLGLQIRTELQSSSTSSKVGGVGDKKSSDSRFKLRRFRLDFIGKVNHTSSFRLRIRGDKDGIIDGNGQSQNIELAYLDYSPIPILTLRFGKQLTFHGGAEGIDLALGNLYTISSEALAAGGFLSMTGLSIYYLLGKGNTIAFYAGNSTEVDSQLQDNTHTPRIGMFYKGDFKLGKTYFSYFSTPKESRKETEGNGVFAYEKGTDSAVTLSGMGEYKGVGMALTYMATTFGKQKINGIETNDTSLSSLVLCADYKLGPLVPKLKFESSEQKTEEDSESIIKWSKFAVMADFTPEEGGLTYYGAMINNVKKAGKSVVTKTTTKHILVGAFLNTSEALKLN